MSTPIEAAFVVACAQAAVAALPLVGRGDGDAVDQAAVTALRAALDAIPASGRIVAGEGEKDAAPMLYAGEAFGSGGPPIDVAVDPVDGTRLAAAGDAGAMVVLAAVPRGALFDIGPAHYLEKIVAAVPGVSLRLSAAENLEIVAAATGRPVTELRVAVQDRPRNAGHAEAYAAAGARIDVFAHGDIERSLRVLLPGGGLDLLVGIGGAPEGLVTAVAAHAVGGSMEARPAPQNETEAGRIAAAGIASARIVPLDELVTEAGSVVVASVTGVGLGDRLLAPASPRRVQSVILNGDGALFVDTDAAKT